MKQGVVVGISGGVDSTAAGLFLHESGFDVFGLCLHIFGDNPPPLPSNLPFPMKVLDVRSEFHKHVLDKSVEAYRKGETPNPCVLCNPAIKWRFLANYADELGYARIATGHYARIIEQEGFFYIAQAQDIKRDQSYFLYRLTQPILSRMILPMCNYSKEDAKDIVSRYGVNINKLPHSRDLCFLPQRSMVDFLRDSSSETIEGEIWHVDGRRLGLHPAIEGLTVGQRQRLGIPNTEPLYVISVDLKAKKVLVGERQFLYQEDFPVECLHWAAFEPELPAEFTVRLRSTHAGTKCTVYRAESGEYRIRLHTPEFAVTPGQSAVLYENGLVKGGGNVSLHHSVQTHNS